MDKGDGLDLKALVIDDNEINVIILANMLELFQIEVDKASNGRTAIEMVKKYRYDIIFVDHFMPEMNGICTTYYMRKYGDSQNKTVILALTSNLSEEVKNLYKKVGVNDVLLKPLEIPALISIIRKWFPRIPMERISSIKDYIYIRKDSDNISDAFEDIEEIDYSYGINNVVGNITLYVYILKISYKDLHNGIEKLLSCIERDAFTEIKTHVHTIKNILCNIGAIDLLERINDLEKNIEAGNDVQIRQYLFHFINQLEVLKKRLLKVINKYDHSKKEENFSEHIQVIADNEFEQYLMDLICYMKRYEYDSIISLLEKLICSQHSIYKKLFQKALDEIQIYHYEEALSIIQKIKEEIDYKGTSFKI